MVSEEFILPCECWRRPSDYINHCGNIQKRIGIRHINFGKKVDEGNTQQTNDGVRIAHNCHIHNVHEIHVYTPDPHH